MIKFNLPAKMLNDILNSTSTKGNIFVIPSESGLSISNSREEEAISVYNMIPEGSLDLFEYDEKVNDYVYCFTVSDVSELISKIQGNVSLSFDILEPSKKSYMHLESGNKKITCSALLKDETTMKGTLGLSENKMNSRHQLMIAIDDYTFVIPEVMAAMGENKLIELENPYSPLIVESDDVSLIVTKNQIQEHINTITTSNTYIESFKNSIILNGDEKDFDKKIELPITSSYLESAIKKHKGQVTHFLLLKLASKSTPYNIVFLSKKEFNDKFFYTSTILKIRNKIEY
jgi:hypothetical protein